VPISVLVRTFTGTVLQSVTAPLVKEMCDLAREIDLPLLGGVDPYDNTVFNSLQVVRVRSELEILRLNDSGKFEAVIEGIISLIDLVQQKSHRYLLFSGD
jgi:hypothetical protein